MKWILKQSNSQYLVKLFTAVLITNGICGCRTRLPSPCERDVLRSGELCQFVAAEVASYGVNFQCPWPTNVANCSWRVRLDVEGTQIYAPAVHFTDVDLCLRKLFNSQPSICYSQYVAYVDQNQGVVVSYRLSNGSYPPTGPAFVKDGFLHISIAKPKK
jgi:hypothetical protein